MVHEKRGLTLASPLCSSRSAFQSVNRISPEHVPRSFRGGCREITQEPVSRGWHNESGSAMPGVGHGARGPDPIEHSVVAEWHHAPARLVRYASRDVSIAD